MTELQLKRDYEQMVIHLQQANKIAAKLGLYLNPVQDSAPKRGASIKRQAAIKARVQAKRERTLSKYQTI